ncbi:hypothetical protein ACIHJG_36120 [Streptomyces sp. NPDC052415]|uniref:hypothetical protein n=1 Tax=Streptomyces sp. NPDC052415 TaxID=3365690 RepID=UPI0037D04C61
MAILLSVSLLEVICGTLMGFLSFPSWGLVDQSFLLGKVLSAIFFFGALVCLVTAQARRK